MRFRWLLLGLVATVLLVPAGALSVARVGSPPGGSWLRLTAFTPYALPLYVAALLLLGTAWLATEGRWIAVAGTGTVLALTGAVLHAAFLAPAFVGGVTEADRGEPVRVMTLNLMLGRADPDGVVEAATARRADLLVLQEVDPDAWERLEAAGVAERFPHRAGDPAEGAAGTLVLARQPLEEPTSLGTALGGLQVRVGGLTVLAVHPRPPVGDASGWVEDHRAVRRAAYDRAGATLIVGDFNATVDHRVMRELAGRGYTDAATDANAGWQPTWPADGQVRLAGVPVPPLVAIDHVLTNDVLHAVSTETVPVEGTDHRALVATLSR